MKNYFLKFKLYEKYKKYILGCVWLLKVLRKEKSILKKLFSHLVI